jgi:hypothetical protein
VERLGRLSPPTEGRVELHLEREREMRQLAVCISPEQRAEDTSRGVRAGAGMLDNSG